MDHPLLLLEALSLVAAFAAWAYAVSAGAYGSKGALLALVGYVLSAALIQGILAFLPGFSAHPVLVGVLAAANAVVGVGTAVSLVREIRGRRGPIQWGTAAFFLAPLALWVLVGLAARSLGA
jgi:hypothetical protein